MKMEMEVAVGDWARALGLAVVVTAVPLVAAVRDRWRRLYVCRHVLRPMLRWAWSGQGASSFFAHVGALRVPSGTSTAAWYMADSTRGVTEFTRGAW